MAERKSNEKKTRNWACVVYPESAPENWVEVLDNYRIPALVSPLHDKDINPGGEIKKAHYHIVIMFEGPREEHIARTIFESFGGVGCEYVNSIRGYARYLCHLDNPEKCQYSQSDVKSMNGADFDSIIGLPSDKYKVIGEMIDFCEENQIVSYMELVVYARANKYDWFKVLCDNGSYIMIEYLKSKDWTMKQPK